VRGRIAPRGAPPLVGASPARFDAAHTAATNAPVSRRFLLGMPRLLTPLMVPVRLPFTDDAGHGLSPVCSTPLGPFDPLRLGEHIHGHLGWLAAVSLMHPAILLRRTKRSAHLSVGFAVGIATLAGALGVALYGPYRDTLKQPIFAGSPAVGYIFERKEHLAFGAILFAWAGTVAYLGARQGGSPHEPLRKAAHWAFIASAGFALLSAVMGTIVASYKTF